jgi:hypothetical protein
VRIEMPTIEFKFEHERNDLSREEYKEYYKTIIENSNLTVLDSEMSPCVGNDSVRYKYHVKGSFFNMNHGKLLKTISKEQEKYFPDSINVKFF